MKGDLYILNRIQIDAFIMEKGNKLKACESIADQTGLGVKTLYNKQGICNPKKRVIPYAIASGLQTHRSKKERFEKDDYDFSDYVLDVRRTLILMNATGETLFRTNEKIILTIMLLFYEEKEWWTAEEILKKAKDSGSAAVTGPAIRKSLKEGLPNKVKKSGRVFFESDGDKYRLDIDRIIKHINTSKYVDHLKPVVLS